MRRLFSIAAFALAFGLAACVTPVGGVTTPSGGASIPSSPINLGDWRRNTATSAAQFWQGEISGRYHTGLAITAVSSDLRRNDFSCANNRDTGGRGDPPVQICRKTVTVEGCTHTWQVHLFDTNGDAVLARTRALYDRRCGNDGLLGGPG